MSHIPRSASLDGDNEDQVSVYSCDDTSSVTSALSGAIADVDEISLASTPGKRCMVGGGELVQGMCVGKEKTVQCLCGKGEPVRGMSVGGSSGVCVCVWGPVQGTYVWGGRTRSGYVLGGGSSIQLLWKGV